MVDLVNYVSQNINKIRWKPCESSLEKPEIFVTGTTDEEQNKLGLWNISHLEADSNIKDEMFVKNFEDKSLNLVSTFNIGGDITELLFFKSEGVVASTSAGSVSYLTFDRNFVSCEIFLIYLKRCNCLKTRIWQGSLCKIKKHFLPIHL